MAAPPVVLFAFNRPEATRQTFAAIRAAKPSRLFLVCDGPRDDRSEDAARCAAVRAILDDVDWACDVERIYRPANVGCSGNIELGLDRVFEAVAEAVILEDDCVADPTFFDYCGELLERYRATPRVIHIAGFTLDTPRDLFNGCSYAVSTVGAGWGWATWRDRWQTHRRNCPRPWTPGASRTVRLPDQAYTVLREHRQTGLSGAMRQAVVRGTQESAEVGLPWDNLWAMSGATMCGLALTPAVNMIENVGFGDGATHAKTQRVMPAAQAIALPLVHPSELTVNVAVAREMEFIGLWMPVGPWSRNWRRRMPPGVIRTSVIRALTSRAAYEGWMTYLRLGSRAAKWVRARSGRDTNVTWT